jgi:KDO2-lipid IV(A) lauroyltransferase
MTSIGFYLLYAFAWTISLIPFWLLYRISDFLFIINYYLIGYRRKIVFKNLEKVFPEKSEPEIRKIARAFYRHFSDVIVEFIKCVSIPKRRLEKRIKFLNMELVHDLEKEHRDFALVMAHYNNWEWLVIFPALMRHKFVAIYRPLHNKSIDRLSRTIRSRFNPLLVPMESVYREAVNLRNQDKLFSLFFLADQRPPRTNKYWTHFLKQEVSFFEGVEKLSRKLQLAVIFCDMKKTGRGRYEATLTKLFDNAAETHENTVMQTCIQAMEKEILEAPQYWLWSHNRFKHSRPESFKIIKR